ncbi:magnesium protoporphyrin IX methyltransferase [Ciceribacter sp. L1K23]|uniref:magnesium protoporphyrin IX methyltransferase n=1 Tax=Ciceribacter sp. L1K23 TaxID=2820276 RepID=UPI001B832592|nr:magnesium protoporphyrin IX methyltransferase [Ciceribacter sp. L1K23]MBR0558356.1 magnesium protoporphyrin IX methyltransferase [Ciceribacter sp. L1K23]
MSQTDYMRRTGEIEHYFDRTALDAWKRLTGDQPVSGIRATVRKGRDAMRATLVSWLPQDLSGWRILDAGCGSGVLSMELMDRGADVLGIDLSAQMVAFARQRALDRHPSGNRPTGSVRFESGDMLDPRHGHFDAIVAMDVLIHYQPAEAMRVLEKMASRTSRKLVFTLAPGSRFLRTMLAAGRVFPRGNRSPSIYPVDVRALVGNLVAKPAMSSWSVGRSERIAVGFYTSQAIEVSSS